MKKIVILALVLAFSQGAFAVDDEEITLANGHKVMVPSDPQLAKQELAELKDLSKEIEESASVFFKYMHFLRTKEKDGVGIDPKALFSKTVSFILRGKETHFKKPEELMKKINKEMQVIEDDTDSVEYGSKFCSLEGKGYIQNLTVKTICGTSLVNFTLFFDDAIKINQVVIVQEMVSASTF